MHGSGKPSLGRGYSVVRVSGKGVAEDFLTGFRAGGKVLGRPVDVLAYEGGFLVTDDRAGAVYYVYKR
jgi:glucose/arabinose dehydrogenase